MDAGKKRIWVRGQFVEVTDEVYTAYMRGDRKMRYFEADLKSERPVYGSNGEIKQVLPSREDSLDRLMEENARQFAAAAESVEDVVIRKLAVDKLHTALMQLTKEERDFICALFFDEKTESDVAKALGVSKAGCTDRENALNAIRRVREIRREINAPVSLAPYITETPDMDFIIETVKKTTGHITCNPCLLTEQLMRDAFEKAMAE